MTNNEHSEGSVVNLECPSCAKDTEFKIETGIVCGSCSENMSGTFFTKKVPGAVTILCGSILFGAGYFGFQSGEEAADYSAQNYATVYKVMDMCMKGNAVDLTWEQYSRLTEVCGCVLDHAVRDLDDVEYAGEGYGVLFSKMSAHVEEC
jgi:hypothetical protein